MILLDTLVQVKVYSLCIDPSIEVGKNYLLKWWVPLKVPNRKTIIEMPHKPTVQNSLTYLYVILNTALKARSIYRYPDIEFLTWFLTNVCLLYFAIPSYIKWSCMSKMINKLFISILEMYVYIFICHETIWGI